ncbi:MAG TPA: hypothetical protein DEF04_05575, partial [Clostridiales bacterium]|nr:hypothetical protein [Clostridiales bacterium]
MMEKIFKRVNIVFSLALTFVMLLSLFSYMSKTTETIDASGKEQVKKIKILIDPGHGGMDQGASGD